MTITIAGDLNARIGNDPVANVVGNNGEHVLNNNGQKLIDFAVTNNFKITNSFFRHRYIHKYTWSARGRKSIIDYVLTNHKLSPQIKDTKVFRGYDINSDHFLLKCTCSIRTKWHIPSPNPKVQKQAFKVHLLADTSIRTLYQNRINNLLLQSAMSLNIANE